MESDSLIPLNRMARRLRVPVRWLRAEAESGRIPCVRAERAILVYPPAVQRALIKRANGDNAERRGDNPKPEGDAR